MDFCISRATATDYSKVYPRGIPLASKRQISNDFFKLLYLPVFLEEGLEEIPIGFVCCDVCDSLIPISNQRVAQVCDPLGWQCLSAGSLRGECEMPRIADGRQ
jgi:hypothetical protein